MNDGSNLIPLSENAGGASNALALAESNKVMTEVIASLKIAKMFPRSEADARDKILKDCTRPVLADVAIYEYKRGGTAITGPSIRLAEVMKRAWGNIDSGWREIERRPGESTLQAFAWDKETNVRAVRDFVVKQVRVTSIYKDGKNTGQKKITPLEDERDIYENNANQAARRVRACILELIPGDIVDEAVKQCEATLAAKEEVTTESIAALVKAFEGLKVSKEMLREYVQRDLNPDAISASMMVKLRTVYKSIKDGVGSVEDFFVILPEPKSEEAKADGKSNIDAFKEKQKAETDDMFTGDRPSKNKG